MEQKIQQTVDKMDNEIINFLQRLVQIQSVNPPGNYDEISDFLEKELTELGFEVNVIDVPDELIQKVGKTTARRNVIATLKGTGNGKNLILNAHLDTVPAGDPNKVDLSSFLGPDRKWAYLWKGCV
ncbi:hypothetical protein [Lentibacillus sp. CBA3610]|uniref:hypothetical protein n=1 Tax=Lentibacillus sp. CBA3610 TaxID=2518176 RepID=UPI00159549F2|nr:hypothetical protein [Lentibacillus sp. CBA3610]QKY68298.1 hypothetical protein Len3610_00475 [Lentibacillus sp. CBA3610]